MEKMHETETVVQVGGHAARETNERGEARTVGVRRAVSTLVDRCRGDYKVGVLYLIIRGTRSPTLSRSSAASEVYK